MTLPTKNYIKLFLYRKVNQQKGKVCKLKKVAIIAIISFIFFNLSFLNAKAEALPEDYGAKGALQDTSITLKEALTYAIQDEYLAQARYDAIIKEFGDIRPFSQIKIAEQRHITALLPLFTRYNITVPENNASQYTTTPKTLKEAFEAGVQGEVDNIAMYEKLADLSDLPQDVQTVMTRLGDASKNHLAAFKKGLSQYE
ncbi:DUF2202 domain-containing protein [Alkalihalobacillus hwajinpoensis]|nr:DUF2202 domain-containing protein [Pseudalkalibacillus hwajinpoensis]